MWGPTAGGLASELSHVQEVLEGYRRSECGTSWVGEGSAHNPLEAVSLRFLPVCQEGCPLQEDGQ